MKTSEIINKTKSILFERGWRQSDIEAPDGSLCVLGALSVARHGTTVGLWDEEDGEVILATIGRTDVGGWNDEPGRTFSEVIDMLDLAEKKALISEELEAFQGTPTTLGSQKALIAEEGTR